MTAVEWLCSKLPTIDNNDPYYRDIFEQAKQMEKEHIKRQALDDYNMGYHDAVCNHINDAEQYYNQKYKQLL